MTDTRNDTRRALIRVRPAELTPEPRTHGGPERTGDIGEIVRLIRELAEYEREPQAAVATEEMIRLSLFGDAFGTHQRGGVTVNGVPRSGPVAECFMGEVRESGEPDTHAHWRVQGFALFFTNYSTWLGRPGLYLEDLFVRPSHRGCGLGKALLCEVVRTAARRGCARVEWNVLDWNTPALEFYRRLGAVGMTEWTIHRLSGEAIDRVAGM